MASRPRPDYIDLGDSRSLNPGHRFDRPSPGEAPSPQSGTIPPALSPLDAFALQGRILASKFEQENGRRVSRLPPLTIANELSRPRPGYSPSPQSPVSGRDDPRTPKADIREPSGFSPEVARTNERHKSYYPSIQSFDDNFSNYGHDAASADKSMLEPVSEERSPDRTEQHGFRRAESPESMKDYIREDRSYAQQGPHSTAGPSKQSSASDSLVSASSLAPPHSFSTGSQRSPTGPSPKSRVRIDSRDDSDRLSFHSDPFDLTIYDRKPSTSNVRDRPGSPFSPVTLFRRSPSLSSELSVPDAVIQPRRSVNFSRPRSPAGLQRPSFDSRPSFENSTRVLHADDSPEPTPSLDNYVRMRQDEDSREPAPSLEHNARTLTIESPELRPSMDVLSISESVDSPSLEPIHIPDDDLSNLPGGIEETRAPGDSNPAPSYIYTKYSLPRGRKVMSRTSIAAQDWLSHKFEWDQPKVESNAVSVKQEARQGPQLENNAVSMDRDVRQRSRKESDCRPAARQHRQGPQTENSSVTVPRQANQEQQAGNNAVPVARQPRHGPRFLEHLDDDTQARRLPQHQRDLSASAVIAVVPPTPLQTEPPRPRSRSYDASMQSSKKPATPKPSKSSQRNAAAMPMPAPDKPKPVFSEAPTLHHAHKKSRSREETRGRNDSTTSSHSKDSSTADQLTPEQHLAKGIACHEAGALQKSTYHLRIAARGGSPTAMLLYALACRHGWGMRPNQAEGVMWLRKAVDLSKLEVAGDELLLAPASMSTTNTNPNTTTTTSSQPADGAAQTKHNADALARKTHKAQLALSIYELGVSYMNGWGIATDKTLALRCFDIAGGWGDADALAEAGFCYAKSVGCKKDLYKAAGLYREAEGRGISMAGNSW